MKRIFLFMCILCLCTTPSPGFAHGDEATITILSPSPSEGILDASTYLHPVQAESLLRETYGKIWKGTPDFFRYQGELFTYLEQHTSLKNNGKKCAFFAKDIPLRDEITLVADGLQLNYSWICSEALHHLRLTNSLFVDEVPDQQNHVEIHLTTTTPPISHALFTQSNTEQDLLFEPLKFTQQETPPAPAPSSPGLFRKLISSLRIFFLHRLREILPQRYIDSWI